MTQHGSERPHELKLDLPAAHSAERMARSVLRQFARSEGVLEKEIETIEFVASELLSNAVDHGGGDHAMEESDLKGRVRMTLTFTVREDGWALSVGDQGGGDPSEIEPMLSDQTLPDLESDRGRGFFLLAQMLEGLAVQRSSDGLGLEITATRVYSKRK
jgi:anti-sigma regulatory factor (Ser/Thr protein kinase)